MFYSGMRVALSLAMRKRKQIAVMFIFATAFAVSSCGRDGAMPANGVASTENSGTSHALPNVDWLEVHEEHSPVLMGRISGCDKPYRFRVANDGSYVAGPCKSHGSANTGRLEDADLIKIDGAARAFAADRLEYAPDCEIHLHLGSDQVFLVMPPNSTLRVKSYRPASFKACYHGGQAKKLSNVVQRLMKKYYPRD